MTLHARKARVGLASFSFLLNEESAQERRRWSVRQLEEAGLEVACDLQVRTTADVQSAVEALNAAQADLAVLCFSDWVREDLPMAVARDLRAPVLLWGIIGESASLPLAGLACSASNLQRIGVPFRYVVGEPESRASRREILEWARAAAAARVLRDLRMGLVGLSCPGLISTSGSEIDVRQLGPHVEVLDSLRLMAGYDEADSEAVKQAVARFSSRDLQLDGPGAQDLTNAARLYVAIKEIVAQEQLDVIGVRCWPDLRRYRGLSPCLAFSRLMDEGVMGSCENDPFQGVAMALGYCLSGGPVFAADINTILEDGSLLKLWHCGAASLALRGTGKVQVRRTFYDNCGCTFDFHLKPGAVTLLGLSRPRQGRCSLLVTSGEVVEGEGPVRGNQAAVRLAAPASEFVDALVGGGFNHHVVVAYAGIVGELEKLASLLNLTLVKAPVCNR